jgi:dolichol kinase
MEEVRNKISFASELKRKLIHISSSWIAFACLFLSKDIMLVIIGSAFFGCLLFDVFRVYSKGFNDFYLKYIGPVLRSHEYHIKKITFTGATYLMFAALLCIIIFPREVAFAAILLMTIGDAAAAIVGKSYGKVNIFTKTLEGSIAFFVSGLIIIVLMPKLTTDPNELYVGIAAVILTSIIEVMPLKLDDNITVPLVFGLSYITFFKLFL